jgi:hypothetical protein
MQARPVLFLRVASQPTDLSATVREGIKKIKEWGRQDQNNDEEEVPVILLIEQIPFPSTQQ